MTVYPFQIDSDETIVRIDDNLSELGTEAINQLRSAVFAIEETLGVIPQGSESTLADRISVSLNSNGTIKQSALASIGLVTLPIDNSQIGSGAGIAESKLDLAYSTGDLFSMIATNESILSSTASFVTTVNANLLAHISGANLVNGDNGRHVGSQIDLNGVPNDIRDPLFYWTGLLDRDGNPRSATTVAEALLQINDAFVDHENNTTGDAHFASGIGVDTAGFLTIPKSANTVQKALDAIDLADALVIQEHQQNHHTNGIPREARSNLIGNADGYSQNIIPPTPATALLVNSPSTIPVDNNTTGDDIISFYPDNSGYAFDAKFAQVSVGDIVRINYGNGIEGVFTIESKRHIPGSEWIVRINGINLFNSDGYSASARVDKKRFDTNKYGTLAIAHANNDLNPAIMSSVIVGNPRGAQATGIAFDATQLTSDNYNLYLALYPTGNPEDEVIELPAIDVTGNAGTTPGKYTLKGVVKTINDKFRSSGYNYRFIAFERDGEFGIMIADAIDNASFSIINGTVSGGGIVEGSFVYNVVGDATNDRDALGLGSRKAALASPVYTTSYSSGTAASLFPTVIISPLASKNYTANGISRDDFSKTYLSTDGAWDGYISNRVPVGATTVETTYQVPGNLARAELKAGKTIVVQPVVARDSSLYSISDYGRFIIKEVNFTDCCPDVDAYTSITVINSLHATASPIGISAVPPLQVKIYFSEDSVSFNQSNVIDPINGNNYIRHHEIYADEFGKTFSHERARMPVQAETTTLLNTTIGFRITEVSPKLKGYLDGTSDFNRFVRFYVLNYDSTSGEYDGYIGRRITPTANITDFGRITRARKNVPTRFYDASDVDYVEIQYTELDQYPGTSILSSSLSRYVDIEVFPTLATNQEYLRLAGCNLVNNAVDDIKDLREFGNVSEIDFTDSAIKFIEAGNRYLHSNGVIAGLTFIGEDVALPGNLAFNGGIAIVNGHIVSLNSQYVSIPQIVQDTGSGSDNTLDWGICVTEDGILTAIPITATKQMFFARRLADTDNYYIKSATFSELTSERKDLTLIAVTSVTIASITVNSVRDARKVVAHETQNIPLVLARNDDVYGTSQGKNSVIGHFSSFEQVKEYVNGYAINSGLYVRVKGNILIDTEVDLSDLDYPLILDGEEGNLIVVTSETGIKINSNIKLKNLNFVYNTVFSGLNSGDNAHLYKGDACVYGDGSSVSIDSVEVTDCTFTRDSTGQRPPFVMLSAAHAGEISNVKISRNKFTPDTSDTLNSAITLFLNSTSTTPGVSVGTFRDVEISNNRIFGKNSILLTANSGNLHPLMRDVYVERNILESGDIGYLSMGDIDGYQPSDSGLVIHRNKARFIGRMSELGQQSSAGLVDYGTGFVEFSNNKSTHIHALCLDANTPVSRSVMQKTHIKNNELFGDTPIGTLTSDIGFNVSAGIYVTGSINNGSIIGQSPIVISGNTLTCTNDTNTVYFYGILCGGVEAIIERNFINKFSAIGILDASSRGCVIKSNTIIRDTYSVGSYINAGVNARITDNILDKTTTNGTDEVTINATYNAYINGNVNCVISHNITGTQRRGFIPKIPTTNGYLSYANPLQGLSISSIVNNFSDSTDVSFNINVSAFASGVYLILPFNEILPPGAKLFRASMEVGVADIAVFTTLALSISVVNTDGTTLASEILNLKADNISSGTCTLDVSTFNYRNYSRYANDESLSLLISLSETAATAEGVTIGKGTVSYTF